MMGRIDRSCYTRRTLFIGTTLFVMSARRDSASAAPASAGVLPGERLMSGPAAVIGTIEFPADLPASPPATIYARIEDVSLADAPSTVLASVTLTDVSVPPPPGEIVTFAITVGNYDPSRRYSVRVHVDRDGDGRISVGDLVSTSSHPVLTQGGGMVVTVPVRVV
ncbi:MAG: YbaY family lipoprotein [Thermomicrobiales bacterium]